MSAIFISYRREDAEDSNRALYEGLARKFGKDRLFMDVEAVAPGIDFREEIERSLSSCEVLLAVIGPGWLNIRAPNDDSGGRRLDNPEDYVRREIATALKKNPRLPVIPLLVRDAKMPTADQLPGDLKEVPWREYFDVRHRHWRGDVDELGNIIAVHLAKSESRPRAAASVTSLGIATQVAPQEPRPSRSDDPVRDRLGDTAPLRWPIPSSSDDPVWERLVETIAWYDRKSIHHRKMYQGIKILEVTALAAIPFLSALIVSQLVTSGTGRLVSGTIGGLAVLITVLEGLLQLKQYQQNWIACRSSCEGLKHEEHTYLAGTAPYHDAPVPHALLAERVESLILQERCKRVSFQKEEHLVSQPASYS